HAGTGRRGEWQAHYSQRARQGHDRTGAHSVQGNSRMSRTRVLLADDHRLVAEGLVRVLEPHFELLDIVEDGQTLLDRARGLQPDVIVSDISMPGLSGLEMLEKLKSTHPDARVVFLTMHHNVSYARQAMSLGAMGYVLKHSAADELILAVRAAATGRTFVSPSIAGE